MQIHPLNKIPGSVIRWGIIGCGDVTEVKSGPGFESASGSRLVAVMRRNGTLAADYARRHNVPRWFDDGDRLIEDDEVDAVYVATPPAFHMQYALKAAAAGKPVYLEKPMARNAEESDRIRDAFTQAQLPLFVAYYRRALPRFLSIKDLIAKGAIGTVTSVTSYFAAPYHRLAPTWRNDAASAGGGHFVDRGSHTLDLIDYLLGPLTDVAGVASNLASNYEVEDTVSLSFRTMCGALGAGLWNFASEVHCDRLEISGTDGQIECSVFEDAPVRLKNSHGVYALEHEKILHVQQPLIQTAVDELLGRGSCPSTGVSACRTAHVMDRALAAYYGDRKGPFWERADAWPGRHGRVNRPGRADS